MKALAEEWKKRDKEREIIMKKKVQVGFPQDLGLETYKYLEIKILFKLTIYGSVIM